MKHSGNFPKVIQFYDKPFIYYLFAILLAHTRITSAFHEFEFYFLFYKFNHTFLACLPACLLPTFPKSRPIFHLQFDRILNLSQNMDLIILSKIYRTNRRQKMWSVIWNVYYKIDWCIQTIKLNNIWPATRWTWTSFEALFRKIH